MTQESKHIYGIGDHNHKKTYEVQIAKPVLSKSKHKINVHIPQIKSNETNNKR